VQIGGNFGWFGLRRRVLCARPRAAGKPSREDHSPQRQTDTLACRRRDRTGTNPTRALSQIRSPKKKHVDDYHITVSVTVALCETLPDVAVTVIG
jgi:hypothetical protein